MRLCTYLQDAAFLNQNQGKTSDANNTVAGAACLASVDGLNPKHRKFFITYNYLLVTRGRHLREVVRLV